MFSAILGHSTDPEPNLPHVDEDLDTVLEQISNGRRRLIIQIVSDLGDDTIRRREMAERIAAIENGIEQYDLGSQQKKRVHVGMYHHLPKLSDWGIIEYNDDRGTISATSKTVEVADFIDALDWATGGGA